MGRLVPRAWTAHAPQSLLQCLPHDHAAAAAATGRCWRRAPLLLACRRSTGPLLQQRRGGFNKFDAVSFAGRSRNVANAFNPLEMNLFDDPMGGLTAGPAEELSTTEIENQVRLNVSSYPRSLFYLLYTPFVDVVAVVLERGLVPDAACAGEVMCRWFTDGPATLQNPSCVVEAMGAATWRKLCDGLDAFYADVEPVMPLTAAVRRHRLPEELLVPFLRQLAMDLLVPTRKRAVLEILPGLILGLANGRAPAALCFPADSQRERAIAAADLFLAAGQETGNTDLAYLGIQLLRANDIPVPFLRQKQLTNVFSAATRIQTDWQMRVSGQLVEVLPKWMDYYKKVHHDNVLAMKRLNEVAAAAAEGENTTVKSATVVAQSRESGECRRDGTTGGTTATVVNSNRSSGSYDDDGVHDYFTSHRTEKAARLSDLESRIVECVRKREVEWRDDDNQLYSRFRRRRLSSLEETDTHEIEKVKQQEDVGKAEETKAKQRVRQTRKKAVTPEESERDASADAPVAAGDTTKSLPADEGSEAPKKAKGRRGRKAKTPAQAWLEENNDNDSSDKGAVETFPAADRSTCEGTGESVDQEKSGAQKARGTPHGVGSLLSF